MLYPKADYLRRLAALVVRCRRCHGTVSIAAVDELQALEHELDNIEAELGRQIDDLMAWRYRAHNEARARAREESGKRDGELSGRKRGRPTTFKRSA